MSGGFSDLVKVYIENLNLPKDTKNKLIASNPKTLADVSLWLEKNSDVKKEQKININPFSSKLKQNITKEIKLFTDINAKDSKFVQYSFNEIPLVDTDDASWGLGLDRSLSVEKVQYCSRTASRSTASNHTKTTKLPPNNTQEQAVKESQDNAIASIRENINGAIEVVMTQADEQGCISKAYNSVKEYFDAEMSLSSVCRVIYAEKTTADLLQKAQDGTLTKEEYWKTKISSAIDMLTGGRDLTDEERACLEERFAQYTPEELNALIDKIKYTNNEDYPKLTAQVDKLVEEGRRLIQSRGTDSSSVEFSENPNSIRALMKTTSAKELMSFEDVWKAERGVEFSPEAIKQYDEAMAEYATVSMLDAKNKQIHDILKDSMVLVKGNNENAVDPRIREAGEKRLETDLLTVLKSLYGDDEAKINAQLQAVSDGAVGYKDGKLVYNEFSKNNKSYALFNAAQKLLDKVDANYEKVKGPYSVEDYKDKMASAYEQAYGRKNAAQLAKAFENDQEAVVGKIRTGVEYAGMGVMVAGMFICTPMALAGGLTASFGGIGVEALNEVTRKEGLSDEAKQKITQELMTNAALFAAGGVAGKMGSSAKAALLAKKCPTLMACIADIGVDATMSMLGDMVLTGEIDIEGEGLSQLMSILAGHIRAGKFGRNKVSTQDLAPSKNPAFNRALEDMKRTEPEVYKDYELLRNKNMLPDNIASVLMNPKNGKITENLKKDISKMADCVRKGIDPKDAFVPRMKNLDEALKMKKQGEVFSLEGTNDLYIMDESGPVKLDIDRDTYYSLFPPLQQYCTNQGALGDCYFISAVLDASMNNPKARVEFLKMFRQEGNDIIFENKFSNNLELDNFPAKIRFKNAQKRTYPGQKGLIGSIGMQIAEQAYGYKQAINKLAEEMEYNDVPKEQREKMYKELQKVFENPDYKPSKELNEMLVDIMKSDDEHTGRYKNITADTPNLVEKFREYAIGNGGSTTSTIMDFFGLDSSCIMRIENISSAQRIEDVLKAHKSDPNVIMTAGTSFKTKMPSELKILFGINDDGKNLLVGKHAYRIESYDLDKKTVSVVNPWDTTKTVELTFEQFAKYFDSVSFADLSKKTASTLSSEMKSKAQELNIPIKSKSGRFYSTQEFIEKYAEKLENEKHLSRPKTENNGADYDYKKEQVFRENEAVAELLNKIDNVIVKHAVLDALVSNCEVNSPEFKKMIKNLEAIIKNSDIGVMAMLNILDIKHSDFVFRIEKAVEIIPKLKQKGFDYNIIETILLNISKDNYDEMKKLWE